MILSSRKKEDLELVKTQCKNSKDVKIVILDLEDYTNFQAKVDEAILLVTLFSVSEPIFEIGLEESYDKKPLGTEKMGVLAQKNERCNPCPDFKNFCFP